MSTDPADHDSHLIAAARGQVEDAERLSRDKAAADLPEIALPGYDIGGEIHRGGQGVVYEAVQIETKRRVAIKVLGQGPFAGRNDRLRFKREVQVLAALKHPNIVTIHDSGVAFGCFYYVMDYIAGLPLDEYLCRLREQSMEQPGRAFVDDVLSLFEKICSAVNAAHLQGVIHRDLKPGNIRIDSSGEPHVLDFGLAKVAGDDRDVTRTPEVTVSGQFVGTLPWTSPEQAEGSTTGIDVRTDVYALGVLLYYALAERFPYSVAGNLHEVVDVIRQQEPTRLSGCGLRINNEVETIVLKCLSKERERRYQSAGELCRDIQRYRSGEPIEAKRDSTWYVLRKTARKHRVPMIAGSAVIVSLAVVAVGMSVLYRRAAGAERIAVEERVGAQRFNAFTQDMLYAVNAAGIDAAGQPYLDALKKMLDDAVRDLDRGNGDPQELAFRRDVIGTLYYGLGQWGLAERQYQEALSIRQRTLGPEHPQTLAATRHWAMSLRAMGRTDEAESALRQVLGVCEQTLAPYHPDTLATMRHLAGVLAAQGKADQAERLYRRSLDSYLTHYGTDDDGTLRTMNEFVALLRQIDKVDEAVKLADEALEISRRLHGADHPATLDTMQKLGVVYARAGQYAKCEELLNQVIEARRRLLGPEHERTIEAMHNLGVAYKVAGRPDRALALLEQVLELRRTTLGLQHPRTLRSSWQYAATLADQGRLEEAENAYRDAIEPFSDQHASYSAQSREIIFTMMKELSGLLADSGRVEEAEELLAVCCEGR